MNCMSKDRQRKKSEKTLKEAGALIEKAYFKVVRPIGIIGFVFAMFCLCTSISVPYIIKYWFALSILVIGFEGARYMNKVFDGGDWGSWGPR